MFGVRCVGGKCAGRADDCGERMSGFAGGICLKLADVQVQLSESQMSRGKCPEGDNCPIGEVCGGECLLAGVQG